MSERSHRLLTDSLFFFYALFAFGSTFSIALAQMALGVALTLFIAVILARRYNPFSSSLRWFYLFVAAYILWMVLSALFGASPSRSLWILKEDWLFCIVPIGVFLFSASRYRERLVLVFAAGVALVSLYGILQHFTGVHWFKDYPCVPADDFGYRVRGNFSHRLTFGNYYGTAAAFLLGYGTLRAHQLARSQRVFFVVTGVLASIVTILSYSRGVIAGLGVALVLLGLLLSRRHLVLILAVLLVTGATVAIVKPGLVGRYSGTASRDFDADYEGGRLFIWKNSWEIVKNHPVLGVGAGNFETEYASMLRPDVLGFRKHVHAHNDFFNVAATHGVPCLALFGGLWISVLGYFFVGWRRRRAFTGEGRFFLAALLGSVVFLFTSLTEATFADEEVRQMLMFIWAAGLWPWDAVSRQTTVLVTNKS